MSERVSVSKPIILEAKGLTRRFNGFLAVNNVNLAIREGSVHALIGPNGAGKTTCFSLLARSLPVSSGTIVYRGDDITALSPEKVARRGIVRSFQISAVFPHLSVLDNVRVALQRPAKLAVQFWRSSKLLAVLDQRALELIEWTGLKSQANELAGSLSYGRKRALELATTLALDPDVLLLDEPLAGMGHEDIRVIADLIRKVAATRTVLMVEHNLSVVKDLCTSVTVLARGEVLAEGTYAEVSENRTVREAYIGSGL